MSVAVTELLDDIVDTGRPGRRCREPRPRARLHRLDPSMLPRRYDLPSFYSGAILSKDNDGP